MIEKLYSLYLDSTGVCTDTRKINKGNIFFALKGENFNGNKYAQEAIDCGAIAVVVDESEYLHNDIFLVEDVLITLQKLASHHREQFEIPIIALTGSNGKTTTKELIASVLKQKYNVHYTKGNLNNHIGVPLTLLEMPLDTEIAIIEMGANHLKEINQLAKIAKPNYGLITNIGKAHLEGFGSLEGVKKGKLELYEFISSTRGHFFVNTRDEILNEAIKENRITYEFIEQETIQPIIEFYFENQLVKSTLFGSYNFQNINAAISVAKYFGVNKIDIIYGIESYIPTNNRSETLLFNSNKIILDAYNANPTSMILSLENFKKREGKKIIVLGSMKELGAHADDEHRALLEYASLCPVEIIIIYGDEFKNIDIPKGLHYCNSHDEIREILNLSNRKNYSVLIKGSRSNRLEAILN